jgi:TolA-binding protein
MSAERPEPRWSDERIDALWRESAPRVLDAPRRRVQRSVALALAAVVLLGLVAVGLRQRRASAPHLLEGASAQGPGVVALTDESLVSLDLGATVDVQHAQTDDVQVRVSQGRAHFAVTRNAQRLFHVLVGDVEVRVVGTRFFVEQGPRVQVDVEEGIVEVREGGRVHRLTAGEHWRQPAPSEAPPPEVPEEAPAHVDAPLEEPPAPHVAPARPPPPRPAMPAPKAPTPVPLPPDANELFRAAIEARRGAPAEAAAAWTRFLAAAPHDARAGLAAFELGRLEMDVTHDDAHALSALERALALSPQGAFAEDALARVVRLHAARGDAEACRAARETYARRYPQGSHLSTLSQVCEHGAP